MTVAAEFTRAVQLVMTSGTIFAFQNQNREVINRFQGLNRHERLVIAHFYC